MSRVVRALAWFRRDLRVDDNRMLQEASSVAEEVLPVYVADDDLLARHAAAVGRVVWFGENVAELDRRLRDHDSGLTVLRGRPEEVLRSFASEVGASLVVAAADEDPLAIARDRRVAAALELRLVDDARIVPPGELRTAEGAMYGVFSPFRRALERRLDEEGERLTRRADADLRRLARPLVREAPVRPEPSHQLPEAGERAASDLLRAFLRGPIAAYADERDVPAADATSHLSPYLRVGALSIRACWRAALNAEARGRERNDRALLRGAVAWRGELAWREFFAHVLHAHPRLAREAYRRELDSLGWATGPDADAAVAAWRDGRTGYPFVDAGMRQLVATGWMHNRARLATASFLAKDIGVDWRIGEAVFADHLIDADTQQNNGNWQWVAGVGTDAAPYFRVFNPTLQARRFDPDGTYIRRWLPELADVPLEHLHEPWRAPVPPRDYPAPILDHAVARRRALARYESATSGRPS